MSCFLSATSSVCKKVFFLLGLLLVCGLLPAAARAQCTLNQTDPSVTICTPANGATVTSPVHIVAGTTDSHTVVSMKIYVDGVSSFLQNNTSSIDTSLAMSAGAHRITVKAWDNASPQQVFSQSINITVGTGGNNTPPFGWLDNAVNAADNTHTVPQGGTLTVVGWAADQQDNAPVAKVQVLIDGSVVGNATLGDSRPDVASALNNPADTNSGWHFNFAVPSTLAAGSHVVSAVAFDSAGASATLNNSITVTVTSASGNTPPFGWLDSAVNSANGSTTVPQGGTLAVTGWAADQQDGSPVAKVQVLIDGSVIGNATLGGSRPDVANAFNNPNYANSGWSLSFAVTTSLSTGSHTVTAVAFDSAGASAAVGNKATINVTGSGGGNGLNVLTYHYNNARTGLNPNETILTPQNVNVSTFGKVWTYSVDGFVFAQPLYVSGLKIGGGTHNVVFIATENDSVYAFDADSNTQFWHTGFTNGSTITAVPSTDVNDSNTGSTTGITGTPVIDLGTNTIYFVTATKENTSYFQRLHALDLSTGAEKFNGPHTITASVPGTGSPSDGNGNVLFDPKLELQRPGLMLDGGVVYVAWGSHNDTSPWHGWVMAFDSGTLGLISAWNVTPSGNAGGIWGSGGAPATDGNGNIYVMTGNGTNNTGSGGAEYSMSFVNLHLTNGQLTPVDFFTPFNYSTLNAGDVDVGSGSVLLIPGNAHPQLAIGGGKEGRLYVVNAGNLGGFNASTDNVIQERDDFPNNKIYGPPAFWNGHFYLGAGNNPINQYSLSASDQLSLTTSTVTVYGTRGSIPTVSSNGNNAGIVWAADNTGAMHAYDATNISNELYNTTQNSARDAAAGNKFPSITVVNGRVYVPQRGAVTVYGLLP